LSFGTVTTKRPGFAAISSSVAALVGDKKIAPHRGPVARPAAARATGRMRGQHPMLGRREYPDAGNIV